MKITANKINESKRAKPKRAYNKMGNLQGEKKANQKEQNKIASTTKLISAFLIRCFDVLRLFLGCENVHCSYQKFFIQLRSIY